MGSGGQRRAYGCPVSVREGSFIRVKAMVVLLNAGRSHHAVVRFTDTSGELLHFHRLVGGGVEPGERSVDAVVREVGEELGTTLIEPRLLGVVESIYVNEGGPGHEVVFVYAGELADPDIIPPGGGWFQDNGEPMFVQWREVEDTGHPLPLYPEAAGGLVRSLL
jgi:8-oxo-dGTP pyrophosphatase MutT (NUDIX family)